MATLVSYMTGHTAVKPGFIIGAQVLSTAHVGYVVLTGRSTAGPGKVSFGSPPCCRGVTRRHEMRFIREIHQRALSCVDLCEAGLPHALELQRSEGQQYCYALS